MYIESFVSTYVHYVKSFLIFGSETWSMKVKHGSGSMGMIR